jgi:hypothetical protein
LGDGWCGHSLLKDKFPESYEICNEQSIIVAAATNLRWRLSFRRWMSTNLQEQWDGLLNILNQGTLTDAMDRPIWKWTKNGQFTVKSLYKKLCKNVIDRSFKHLWKSKLPLKIKVWLWLI